MSSIKKQIVIAVVEDEEDISELICLHLKKSLFSTKPFYDASSFLEYLNNFKQTGDIPDFILLDLMLPDMDGMELCKYIRGNDTLKHIPIIMLTAKQDETDMILGLELGADDYVTKPFSPRALVTRIKTVLRRTSTISQNKEDGIDTNSDILNIANEIYIDSGRYVVLDSNKNELPLTMTEFKLLDILARKSGWAFSREKLIGLLWGGDRCVTDRTIDVHIKHLREKLGESGRFIKNIRGVGYKIVTTDSE